MLNQNQKDNRALLKIDWTAAISNQRLKLVLVSQLPIIASYPQKARPNF